MLATRFAAAEAIVKILFIVQWQLTLKAAKAAATQM